MKRLFLAFTPILLSLFAAGCGDDPAGTSAPNDFSGDWTLVSTIVQKAACLGGQPSEVLIEEVTISQDGAAVTLEFADASLQGTAVDGVLNASGELADGEAVAFELVKNGSSLSGSVRIDGDGCQERRTVVATRRVEDADFSGHWALQLTVVGEGGCSYIVDYSDCFRIFQTDRDLLVIDADAGNLFGKVTGNVAELERDTPAENTWLILYINGSENRLTGSAYRYFSADPCRTDLEFVAVPHDGPCSNPKHLL
jgi:hypothetical protein